MGGSNPQGVNDQTLKNDWVKCSLTVRIDFSVRQPKGYL
jgi:hypothetical protein